MRLHLDLPQIVNWNPAQLESCKSTFTETFDMDKDIKYMKHILKVTSKIKAYQTNKWVDINITKCCILFCLCLTLLFSLKSQTSVNRWFLLFIVLLKNFSIVSFFKKTVQKSQERALSHLYETISTVMVSKMLAFNFLQENTQLQMFASTIYSNIEWVAQVWD